MTSALTFESKKKAGGKILILSLRALSLWFKNSKVEDV